MYGLNDPLARIVMAYIDTLLTSIHVFLEILPNPYMFSRRIPIGIYPERALLTVTAGTGISRYPFLSFTYLLIPIFIFIFVTLSVVSLVFSTLVTTSFYSILISIYSEFYLQTTLSHYHRTRLRVSLTYILSSFIHYLLLFPMVDISNYNRFVSSIQSLPPYPTENISNYNRLWAPLAPKIL